jgi:hypothetical protein
MRTWSTWLLGVALAGATHLAACGSSNKGFDPGNGDDGGAPDGDSLVPSDASLGGADVYKPQGPPPPCDPVACGAAGGTCKSDVCTIGENPGAVDAGTQGKLRGGGTADSGFQWLYPYDRTIFPRGLLPPTLQFGGAAPDAVYVHVRSTGIDYEGFYGASNPGRVTFSAPVWTEMTLAEHAKDDVLVEVTKISGGQVTGPIRETWNVAPGTIRGTIYYETYDSGIAGGLGSVGIMRIDPGAQKPVVIKSGCGNVCHTASADGSTLVANTVLSFGSASYDLKNNAATIFTPSNLTFTYGGLYPDGSLLMSATHYRTWVNGFGGTPSGLYDTHTGAKIAAPGWDGVVTNGGTTAFSPDGKHIAFNHMDTGGGHSLAAMEFDVTTKTFSNLRDIANDPARTVAWPAFTPDGNWVIYHSGTNTEFETDSGAAGDLHITDLATKTMHRLDAADGYANGMSYLPQNDPDLNFAPTVLPEAVGGYFWVVFTSHRSYGNMLATRDHDDEYGKLWVAAIDLSPTAGQDPSHPAFYLDGQELAADNLRGFWVLSPCRQNGTDCRTGDECCDGYCRPADGGGTVCTTAPGGCSNEFEKCSTAADCCDKNDQCINGRCAQQGPR